MSDPTVSHHARSRCAEMGISTKVAKAIAKSPSVTYTGNIKDSPSRMYLSDKHPEYAVVVDPSQTPMHIVTVLFRTEDDYVRNGSTFTVFPSKEA